MRGDECDVCEMHVVQTLVVHMRSMHLVQWDAERDARKFREVCPLVEDDVYADVTSQVPARDESRDS